MTIRTGLTTIEPTILHPSGIDLQELDPDAVRATERLIRRGYEAYLVGGCVRDLLLGRKPKDYDIATAARPQQVKRTFPRNCRIIGRRFKLAHLHFHRNTKILEVSTFRRTPQGVGEDGEDLLITRDNEFGNAEEDALRRDFTVNALFLDPVEDRILDYTNGLQDLRARVIRTIGDPSVRFREDPVRILRATKFAGRLGFQVEPETLRAMAEVAPDLVRAAPPRLLEEILRLLRGGHSLDSFQLLRDIGAIRHLLPVVADFLAKAHQQQRVLFWRILEALDEKVLAGSVPSNPVLLGALFTCPVTALAEAEGGLSPSTVAEEVLGPFSQALRLPRRDAGCLKRICGVQHRFLAKGKRRFKIASFVRDPYFDEALELFELVCMARGDGLDELRRWRDLAAAERGAPEALVDDHGEEDDEAPAPVGARDEDAQDESSGRKRRRRRRRRRRGGGEGTGSAPDQDERDAHAAFTEAARERGSEPPEPLPEEAIETAGEGAGDRPAEETGRRKRKRRRGKKPAAARAAAQEPPAAGDRTDRQNDKKKARDRAPTRRKGKEPDKRKRGRARKQKVEVLEPEPMDLSAFDVELDPRRVPTFGTIVEGGERRKKRVRRAFIDEGDQGYKPPPPPGSEDEPPPPPPSDDDVFGDW